HQTSEHHGDPHGQAAYKRSPIIEAPNSVSDARAMKGTTGGYTTYPQPRKRPSSICRQLAAMESVRAAGRDVQRNNGEST
ncbi:MAG TPA: hypothetical protein VG273_05525, partial [Bryobacteraceae bacterium]|nr:hypothetical protein [Bryobacteraceae bacterium]